MPRFFALVLTALIGVGIIAIVIAILVGQARQAANPDLFAQCRATHVAGGSGSLGGPFTLINEAGQTVTDADVITEPALLYFGYTFCPDICPLDTVRNAEAVDILTSQGRNTRPVFVSVDPARDTPAVLAAFTDNIHPQLMGLTGTQDQIDAITDAYGVYYRVNQHGDDPYYLVDHTGFTYLVLPQHGFVEFFHRDASPAQVAERTACFIDAAF